LIAVPVGWLLFQLIGWCSNRWLVIDIVVAMVLDVYSIIGIWSDVW